MKKCFLGLICLSLIAFGAYKNYPSILVIGIITLATILFFPIEIIRGAVAAYLKNKYSVDLLKETKDDIFKDLNKEFTIDEKEKDKIYAATTAGSLATATADIITSKKICPSCKKGEMKEIPWENKFNKSIEGKNLASKPQAYKCDNCGNMFIIYSWN